MIGKKTKQVSYQQASDGNQRCQRSSEGIFISTKKKNEEQLLLLFYIFDLFSFFVSCRNHFKLLRGRGDERREVKTMAGAEQLPPSASQALPRF